jgi:hypothetical protein
MAHVLGRVTKPISDERGPDALYELRLPGEWLEQGASIEFELPRHLTCAACGGGGCDACGRSGALTVRSKDQPCEIVPVTLPERRGHPGRPGVVLRIPECGGLPPERSRLPRGLLLLRVLPGQTSAETVRRLDRTDLAVSRRPGRTSFRPSVHHVAMALLLLAALIVAWCSGGP